MRKLITSLLLCGLIMTGGAATTQRNARQQAAARPNIILILADDQGYETIAANGGTSYKTPNIDRLAASGMRFENAYAHPLCTPSRVALTTGQYNFRNYTSFGELRLSEKTFGAMLRDAGYKTCIVGKRPPNFVVIFCDDLGYGDLGSFGNPTIRTPHLDRMAAEGQRWTSFYSADSVCTPSRAALLTGRLPIRTGMFSDTRRVLFPDSAEGLPQSEITIAELLKTRGYATAAIGKWHLGWQPEFLPMKQGFDSYYGIPYSNDMDATFKFSTRDEYIRFMKNPKLEYWNVPLMRNEKIIERPADQTTITQRYTDEAIKFISANKNKPFFLYLAHSMPHMPLFRSKNFENKSIRGLYGDVIEELDANVGRLLDTLRQLKLDRDTLVVFTSDNGPWALFDEQGGSAGLLRGAKGGTYEGGMREPTIFWQPGAIKSGVVTDIGATLDLAPTFCALAGVKPPTDRALDGYDLSVALLGKGRSPRQMMPYWRGSKLYAMRHGSFKAHFITQSEYGGEASVSHSTPELYNLDIDPSEKWDVAAKHPEVIAEIRRLAEEHNKAIPPVENHLDKRITPIR